MSGPEKPPAQETQAKPRLDRATFHFNLPYEMQPYSRKPKCASMGMSTSARARHGTD
ncbi:hypothetical protein HYPGJ_31022 [Hyphomicrobium sp. GJ21]|nr:hypothetical protein HYPGJ_31022 [Hyphomicrobium sp. GJ21]